VSVALEVLEEVSGTQSVGTRWIIAASLLWGSWCRRCLLPDVGVDLTGVNRLLACTWCRSSELLLSSNRSGSIGVLTLLTLFICFSILWWYIRRDGQDLAIQGFELFSRIVRGDRCVGDLKRKTVWRRLLVQPTVVGRSKRSTKLFENTALACGVFGLLVDRAGFVEVIPTAFHDLES
jgi:hypothetical protein